LSSFQALPNLNRFGNKVLQQRPCQVPVEIISWKTWVLKKTQLAQTFSEVYLATYTGKEMKKRGGISGKVSFVERFLIKEPTQEIQKTSYIKAEKRRQNFFPEKFMLGKFAKFYAGCHPK